MREVRPVLDKWTFSTNGVTIMGRNDIPCIGYGPGAEDQAHAPNEITGKRRSSSLCCVLRNFTDSLYEIRNEEK